MTYKSHFLTWAALIAVAGCGNAGSASPEEQAVNPAVRDEASPAAPSSELPTVLPEILNQLEIAGHSLTFHRVMVPEDDGPEASIMLHQTGPMDTADPVRALVAQAGRLTMLEIFSAYARPGQAPHEALAASQRVEAKWLGRSDLDTIVRPVFEKTAIGNPPAAGCTNYVYHDIFPFFWTQKHSLAGSGLANEMLCTGSPIETYTGVGPTQRCNNKTRDWVVAATCNDGNLTNQCTRSIIGQWAYGPSTAGEWVAYPPATLPSGRYQRVEWGPTASNKQPKAMSALGYPNSSSNNPCTVFHLVSGVAVQ